MWGGGGGQNRFWHLLRRRRHRRRRPCRVTAPSWCPPTSLLANSIVGGATVACGSSVPCSHEGGGRVHRRSCRRRRHTRRQIAAAAQTPRNPADAVRIRRQHVFDRTPAPHPAAAGHRSHCRCPASPSGGEGGKEEGGGGEVRGGGMGTSSTMLTAVVPVAVLPLASVTR